MPSGGKRKGAGRPPTADAKQPYNTKLPPDVIAYLRSLENQAALLEAVIRRTTAFKRWKEKQ